MGVGFVCCHLRSAWALNENPRSNLCETWAHSSQTVGIYRRLPLVGTTRWFMLKYFTTSALRITLVMCSPKSMLITSTMGNRATGGYLYFLLQSVFYLYHKNANSRLFTKQGCKYKDCFATWCKRLCNFVRKKWTLSWLRALFLSIRFISFLQNKSYSRFITE